MILSRFISSSFFYINYVLKSYKYSLFIDYFLNCIEVDFKVLANRKPKPEKFGEIIFSIKMPSIIDIKNQVLDDILSCLTKVKLMDDEMGIRLSLDEALSNCIIHGNKRNPDKSVKIEVFYKGKKWGVIFEDEGEGFIPKEIPDFSDPADLMAEGGRGVFLMHYYMDKVSYCGKGNILELVRTSGRKRKKIED